MHNGMRINQLESVPWALNCCGGWLDEEGAGVDRSFASREHLLPKPGGVCGRKADRQFKLSCMTVPWYRGSNWNTGGTAI